MFNNKFSQDVDRFKEKAINLVYAEQRKRVFKIYAMAMMLTPVDTGHARANWQVVPSLSSAERTAIGSTTQILPKYPSYISWKGDTSVYILNYVPYIKYLEYGTDRFAGFFMLKRAVATHITGNISLSI